MHFQKPVYDMVQNTQRLTEFQDNGRASSSDAGGHGLDPYPGYIKDCTHGSSVCPPWRSLMRG